MKGVIIVKLKRNIWRKKEHMVSEVIILVIILLFCFSSIVVSVGKQKQKIHRRNKRWMKEQLKGDK